MTLEKDSDLLKRLTPVEKSYFARMVERFEAGDSYLDFASAYMEPDSMVFRHARRLGRPVAETPLYRACDGLARRLGIQQGFLVRDEVAPSDEEPQAVVRRELLPGRVARLAGCTREAVRQAILGGRLRSRRVGRRSLIWDKDAEAFAECRRSRAGRGRGRG